MKKIKLIYLSHQLNNGTAYGGGLVAHTNLKLIQSLSFVEVKVFSVSESYLEGCYHAKRTKNKIHTALSNLLGLSATLTYSSNKKLVNAINKANPDIVWTDSSLFGKTIKELKRLNSKIRFISFFHNVEYDLQKYRVKKQNILYVASLYSDWINERLTCKNSNKIICLHKEDAKRICEIYKRTPDFIHPITLIKNNLNYTPSNFEKKISKYILFVGSLYGPNIEGLDFLANKVMPYTDRRLLVIGKGLEKIKHKYLYKNIDILGTVDDLEPYYNNAECVVAPIFTGAGMKVKIAEAMMYGCPIIGTTEAFKGYIIPALNKCIQIANSPAEFLNALNKELPYKSRDEIIKIYLTNYSAEAGVKRITKIINETML